MKITSDMGYADQSFALAYGVRLTEEAQEKIDEWERQYTPFKVCKAVCIATEKYSDPEEAFDKIGGILYNWRKFGNNFTYVDKAEVNNR